VLIEIVIAIALGAFGATFDNDPDSDTDFDFDFDLAKTHSCCTARIGCICKDAGPSRISREVV
jgi:hypothetical protein